MTIYIAGPMSGIAEHNRPAFFSAQAVLRSLGGDVTVLNPAVLPATLPDKAYMPICTAMVEASDAIYLLDGWELSAGAKVERAYAKRQGKIIVQQKYARNAEQIEAAIDREVQLVMKRRLKREEKAYGYD